MYLPFDLRLSTSPRCIAEIAPFPNSNDFISQQHPGRSDIDEAMSASDGTSQPNGLGRRMVAIGLRADRGRRWG
jgi:hypothetical protein